MQIKPIKPKIVHDETNLLDLTGSPLKDSCQFELLGDPLIEEFQKKNAWKDNEEIYHAIPLAEAQ